MEAPPKRGTFFRLQVYGRAGFSLLEVHESVGKSVILVCKMTFKKWIYTAVKRDPKFETRYVEGTTFFNERYTEREPSLPKIAYKRQGIRPCGGASLYKTLLSMPHPPPHGDKRDNGSVIGHSTKRTIISILDSCFCH